MFVARSRSADGAVFVVDSGRDVLATRKGGVWSKTAPDMEEISLSFNKVEGKEAESLVQEAIASLSD